MYGADRYRPASKCERQKQGAQRPEHRRGIHGLVHSCTNRRNQEQENRPYSRHGDRGAEIQPHHVLARTVVLGNSADANATEHTSFAVIPRSGLTSSPTVNDGRGNRSGFWTGTIVTGILRSWGLSVC